MNDNFNYCHVVGKTDVGRKRAANEDNMYNTITQNGLVSVVCDGMGGHVGGATASKIAVSTIIENLNNVYYDDPRIAIGESIDRANKAIIQKTTEQPELAGMGSTCVLLLVRSGKVYIGHVGDSRIYLVRSKRIVQLTKDHSYVQMLVDCGEITKEQAEHHPRKNEITNALGIPNMSPATVADDAIIPEAGDCFVLCSDGLSGMVSDDTICKIISRQSEMNAQERVDRLVALANENGGVDNITVQLVEFPVSPNVVTDEKKFPTWAKIASIVSVLIVLGVGGYFWLCNKNGEGTEDKTSIAETGQDNESEILGCYLDEISYKKNAKIVELEYSETTLVLKWGRDGKYTESNVYLDPTTLIIESENVKSQYNNSLLVFTDKTPGESVIFSISTSDKSKIYRYQFNIKNAEEKGGLSIPRGTISQQDSKREDPEKAAPKKEEIVAKVDTVYIQFECDKLEKGARLLLNYSAKPTLIFNSNEIRKEEKVDDSRKIEKVLDGSAYDDLYWTKKLNNGQLFFEFRGESSDKQHTIVIPCAVKGSKDQILISVKISPKKNKEDGDVTPTEEKKKDNSIELQSV
ncbi:MAG: Stp1/IreP family PP2C-type Ser/Thr phosphatase [Alistipes sp.]|nr:Stp1/IreP family PP2C-type Ser/Thr phosphatase [Alistipes sp.]